MENTLQAEGDNTGHPSPTQQILRAAVCLDCHQGLAQVPLLLCSTQGLWPSGDSEIVVEQLLSPCTTPGLGTQWCTVRVQAGNSLVGKLGLQGQRLGGRYPLDISNM